MPERTGKTRQPSAAMSTARATAILGHLDARGVVVWLEGGWGIDGLLGRETRTHDDLDVIVSLDQVEEIEAALRELGYETKRGGAPLSFEVVDADGHQVDVHPVSFLPSGDAVYLMEGGWGIDGLLGRETRTHDDLDVIVSLDQVEEIEAVLRELGYETKRGEAPLSFEVVDADGHQVDVHPVSFLPSGEGIYLMEGGKSWTYPCSSFAGTGMTAGRPVRCLTPGVALVCHSTGYVLDAAHRRDVEALCERFDLPLPL